MIPPITVVCQLLLEAIKAPVLLCRSNAGSANALGTPNRVSSGPMARTMTVFGPFRFNNESANHHIGARLHKAQMH